MNQALAPSSTVFVTALVFSGGEVLDGDEPGAHTSAVLQSLAQSVPGPSSAGPSEPERSDEERKVSTYVRVFEDMIGTVIKEETHLFDDAEFALLTLFAHLSYNARYLMVKLLLRKQETWHRLDTLKYEDELGSASAIIEAIDELCKVGPKPLDIVKKEEPGEQGAIPLTVGEGAANPQREHDKSMPMDVEAPKLPEKDKSLTLARNEQEMDLKSLLQCLRVDELKAIAKQLKLKRINQKKDDLIRKLLGAASSSQSTLTACVCKDGVAQTKGRNYQQTRLTFGNLKSQNDRLKEIVLQHIVKCVRVDEEFFGVIHRVNLVYFRITQYSPDINVAALLTRFGKRAYPGYEYERTRNVWPSRQALIDYERMLILESRVDSLFAGNVPFSAGRAAGSVTPASKLSPTPITPGNVNSSSEGQDFGEKDTVPDLKPDSTRVRGARMVKDIFEREYLHWQDLVKTEGEEGGRANGLERFHHGHVLTRIIYKACAALGILEEYEREVEVLEALLAQKRWRRGRRGVWHERRALILSKHFPKNDDSTERALDAVIEGLEDPDTHMVCRPKLQKRLRELETKLRIPTQERHVCDDVLADASEVFFEAVRLKHRVASLKLDRTGRCVNTDTPRQANQDIKRYYSPVVSSVKPEPSSNVATPSPRKSPSDTLKGKTLWLGRNEEELTVEALALQRYEQEGFKGIHCESRIITMLFGLLFWDIIFEAVPGAFETPYQTAPLDIAEDSFYHARKDLMEERLVEIEAGKGAEFVREVDAQHRASGTWCVGVHWDLLNSEDLVDIIKCIGGKALSVICRVLCEDYIFGTSGGPDLFLWNAAEGTCKFVEVKGPGDTLRKNQQVWIDILLKAPVVVEICRVVESGQDTNKKPSTRRKVPRRKEEMQVDEEDADALPNVFEDPQDTMTTDLTMEERLQGARSPPNFAVVDSSSARTRMQRGTSSSPLKRKASPPEATPSKRSRVS